MDDVWRDIVWRQFGAALEMLENAVRACPAELWGGGGRGAGLGLRGGGLKAGLKPGRLTFVYYNKEGTSMAIRVGGQRRGARASGAEACRRKFLRYFPGGFNDETYLDWERDYKWEAHERWEEALGRAEFRRLLRAGEFSEIAARAVRVEQRTRHSMIFSFEKMALRDAVKTEAGARAFAEGLYELLHGAGSLERRFGRWVEAVAGLPRRQTRVLTWPMVTVWGFLAQPRTHIFLKPTVTRAAAAKYGFDFEYESKPSWETYSGLLAFAERVLADNRDLRPRDMIDAQSFMWVQGSDEYPD